MARMGSTGLVASFVFLLLTLGIGTSSAAAADCPNEVRRQEQGVSALALPHCRAYEMVSPKTFPQQWLNGTSRGAISAPDGNTFAYFEFYPGTFVDNSSLFYYSKRGADGWVAQPAAPQLSTGAHYQYECDPQLFYGTDLMQNVLQVGYHQWRYEDRAGCKTNEAVLDSRENRDYQNLFIHNNLTDAYELASVYPDDANPSNSLFQAASADLGTVLFSAVGSEITPDDPPGLNYYVFSDGVVRLLGYLPDGTPYEGSDTILVGNADELNGIDASVRLNAKTVGGSVYPLFGGFSIPADEGGAALRRTVSSDGSKAFFYAGGSLYVRLNPGEAQSAVVGGVCTEPEKACTIQVDESQGPGTSGGGRMSFASVDGTRAFFTSDRKLTSDSTAVAGKDDIYEYDVETGTLTDLTVNATEAANVQNVTWVSEDGEYVYFVAEAALAPGATKGTCGTYTVSNFCNLYVAHDGDIDFVAALPLDDAVLWGYSNNGTTNVVSRNTYGIGRMLSSPSGTNFAFTSTDDLTSYNSGGAEQIYLYDAVEKGIECVSCPADGEPTDGVEFFSAARGDGAQGVSGGPRSVLDNGRVFFDTTDPLVAEDTGGARDVYMYEAGDRYLLSGGKSQNGAHFQDADPSGDNVFIVTAEPLLPGDGDGASSIYDVRVNGGFPEPPPLPGCEGEACRGAATQAAGTASVGTAGFQGPGNRAQPRKRRCRAASKPARRHGRKATSSQQRKVKKARKCRAAKRGGRR